MAACTEEELDKAFVEAFKKDWEERHPLIDDVEAIVNGRSLITKYYFTSDLHGVSATKLNEALEDNNFDFTKDILVIAGDISDGLGNEDTLIPYLRDLESKGNLIAVKGNHDVEQTRDAALPVGVNNNYMSFQSDEDIDWLYNLPIKYENEHFKLTHGIWVDDKTSSALPKLKVDNLHIWGSPILLDGTRKNSDWWYVDEETTNEFLKNNLSVKDYESKLNKDLYVGHFWNYMVEERDNNKLFKEVQGHFQQYGKITYLDTDVIGSGQVYFYIKEY